MRISLIFCLIIVCLIIVVPVRAWSQAPARRSQERFADSMIGIARVEASPGPAAVELTLQELEQLALRNNPTLAGAAAQLRQTDGQRIQAGLYPNPVAGYHGVEIGLRGTAGQQGAFVSQRIVTAGKRRLDQAIAAQDVNRAQFGYQSQQQRILNDVRLCFYEAAVAQRRVDLTSELASVGDQLAKATQRLVDARQGTESDLLQAEIRADESHILLDNARNERDASWRRLAIVVGQPSLPLTPLESRLESITPSIPWDQCYTLVLAGHPDVEAARARVDRSRIRILRARREPVPNIDLSLSHRYHDVTGNNVTNVQIGVPIPVFDKNQGNIQSAESEWVAACRDLERVKLDLQQQLAQTYREFVSARQQVDRFSQRMLPRAERSLSLVRKGYDQGQVKFLDLLNAQQTYVQVNLSYLSSLGTLWRSWTLIEGKLLSDSLAPRSTTRSSNR